MRGGSPKTWIDAAGLSHVQCKASDVGPYAELPISESAEGVSEETPSTVNPCQDCVFYSFSVEVAAAILRAAAFPLLGESYGYAETSRGDSATLIEYKDGMAKVRVCVVYGPETGFRTVIVRPTIELEVV